MSKMISHVRFAKGTRLKESGYINKSLLALGTVISKLSSAGDERFVYKDNKFMLSEVGESSDPTLLFIRSWLLYPLV